MVLENWSVEAIGVLGAIIIGLGGWFISWWFFRSNKNQIDDIHNETQELTKKIHRVELLQNRPLVALSIVFYSHKYGDVSGSFALNKEILLREYRLSNEGRIAVESWDSTTYYKKTNGLYKVEKDSIRYSSENWGIRIPPEESVEFVPSRTFGRKQNEEYNPIYEYPYPRLLRVVYKDSTHNEYCSCTTYNSNGKQTRELRHREIEKKIKPENYDKKTNLCKDCPLFDNNNIKTIEDLNDSILNNN